ncbi:MAG: ankyrin repeat domain-containing protein [Verrucomicrobiia bacterium]
MKHLLLTTIAAVLLVGCGTLPQSSDIEPAKPVSKSAQPQQPSSKAEALNISIQKAASDGNVEAIKQHLADGTDVNAKGGSGWTPLFYAAFSGRTEVAELLIAEGAEVNAKGGWMVRTPLHYAAFEGHEEIAELLIATKGADVNAKHIGGLTSLDFASANKEIADLLRKHGGKTKKELEPAGN